MSLRFPQKIHYRPSFPEEHLQCMRSIQWFSSILSSSVDPAVRGIQLERVESVTNAVALIESGAWGEFQLERRNDLTSHVSDRTRSRDSEWNKCAAAFRDYFVREIEPSIRNAMGSQQLAESVLASVAWDVISYWQEINYRDLSPPSFFVPLLELYRRGHMPCGWRGDDIERANDAVILYI